VQRVSLAFSLRGGPERRVELGEVARLDHDVKLAHIIRPQAQLAAHHPPAFDPPLIRHVIQESGQGGRKRALVRSGLQVKPDMIDVQGLGLSGILGRLRTCSGLYSGFFRAFIRAF
jgi:hypothetical protein